MAAALGIHHFIEELQAPNQPYISPERFAEALNLRQQELAELAAVHRATILAAPRNAKLQHFMREALRVLSAAMEINPDRVRAIYWYRNAPIAEFGHRTAEQLVAQGKAEAVVSYLASIASGSSG